ncbi:MAG: cation:proton antiporter [Thermoproteota archaeon]|nr:cation:proton antiporter [Thermoproteota archaeon]
MIISSIMALISYKLKQSLIIGYIIAGVLIGPHTPFSLIVNQEFLNVFSEMAVIILLFVAGLEFPIEKLKKVGRKAIIISLSEAFGTFFIGLLIVKSIGFSLFDSLFLALAISVTSTIVVMRVLEELDAIKNEASIMILGVAVIEDIIIISLLAILQSLGTNSLDRVSPYEIIYSIGSVFVFIIGAIVIGPKIVPRLIEIVGKTNQYDLLTTSILGVAFGMAFLAHELGISIAAGAFFAGVLIAESKVHSISKVIVTPLRDMFAALFFISTGALMDFSQISLFIIPSLILVIISFCAKFITVFISSWSQGFSPTQSLKISFGLSSSGGEVSLVVAKAGMSNGGTSSIILSMVGTMTIITTFITPYAIKYGWKFSENITNRIKKKKEG